MLFTGIIIGQLVAMAGEEKEMIFYKTYSYTYFQDRLIIFAMSLITVSVEQSKKIALVVMK